MDLDHRRYVDQVFENQRMEVTGNAFEGCTFKRCRIVFSALEPVSFIDCHFAECDWVFAGPAGTALE